MESLKDSLPAHRARLSTVLQAAKEVVSVDVTSRTLGINRRAAAKLLSRWKQQGWLRRIGHGLYVPVPLDLAGSEQVIADPWVLVPTLFNHCYIGGWTAAHHWELTEQLFNETLVFTTRRLTEKRVIAQGTAFVLHNVKPKRLYGVKTFWRGSVKVNISVLVWSKISNALKRLGFRSRNFLAQLVSETSRACTIRVRRSSFKEALECLGRACSPMSPEQ